LPPFLTKIILETTVSGKMLVEDDESHLSVYPEPGVLTEQGSIIYVSRNPLYFRARLRDDNSKLKSGTTIGARLVIRTMYYSILIGPCDILLISDRFAG